MDYDIKIDPDTWMDDTSGHAPSTLAESLEANEEIDVQEEFGDDYSWLSYEIDTDVKKNTDPENIIAGEGVELDDDGFLYDIEIREMVGTRGQDERFNVDDGLLGVHFTGYRDPEGNDYMVHSDPKKWTADGEMKFEDDDGEPYVEGGLKGEPEDPFSDDTNYEIEAGLERIESYLGHLGSEVEDQALATRWRHLGSAVNGFRRTIDTGQPVNLEYQNQRAEA